GLVTHRIHELTPSLRGHPHIGWTPRAPATLTCVTRDFIFDRATRIEETADGWRAEIGPAWNIFGVPNGGYLATVCLAGASRLVPHPDLLSVSAYYPSKTDPGEALITADAIRIGKRMSTGVPRLHKQGRGL